MTFIGEYIEFINAGIISDSRIAEKIKDELSALGILYKIETGLSAGDVNLTQDLFIQKSRLKDAAEILKKYNIGTNDKAKNYFNDIKHIPCCEIKPQQQENQNYKDIGNNVRKVLYAITTLIFAVYLLNYTDLLRNKTEALSTNYGDEISYTPQKIAWDDSDAIKSNEPIDDEEQAEPQADEEIVQDDIEETDEINIEKPEPVIPAKIPDIVKIEQTPKKNTMENSAPLKQPVKEAIPEKKSISKKESVTVPEKKSDLKPKKNPDDKNTAKPEKLKKTDSIAAGLERNAQFYFEVGLYDQALEIYSKLLKDNPDNGEIKYKTGYCYLKIDKINEAIDLLNSVVKNNPNDKKAVEALLQCYKIKGDSAKIEALNSFLKNK